MKFKLWLLAFRPKTLTAALVPVVVGTALAAAQGQTVHWLMAACALISALFIQIATNLINDAIDFEKGADTHERLGPQRITAGGHAQSRVVLRLGFIFLGLALVFGIPIVMRGGWLFVGVGVASLFLAYGYTAGPLPLAYFGLGDVFVILFFGVIAVAGTYFLHTLNWSKDVLVAGFQIGCLATVLIAINNLRDIHQDVKAHKRTLAVRFGKTFVRCEIAALLISTYALLPYWWMAGFHFAAVLPLLLLPIAARLIFNIFRTEPGVIFNRFLAQAALVHLGFGGTLALGLWMR
jgi:1,4-dihydroxy-2-naphthoate octaprenyltransferase